MWCLVHLHTIASPLLLVLPFHLSQSATVVFLHTGISIKQDSFLLAVLVLKWELLFMGCLEWLHQLSRTLKVMHDLLATFPFIVSFFSCIPLQLPRTGQSAGSSGWEQFMTASIFTVNTRSWHWWLYLWKPLSSYLFLTSSLIVLLHAVHVHQCIQCHQLLLTDPYNLLLCGCSVQHRLGDVLVANAALAAKLQRLLGTWMVCGKLEEGINHIKSNLQD